MEEQVIFGCGSYVNSSREVKFEEDEEDFRSCCEDEDELKEREETAKEGSKNNLDDVSVNMFFKGASIAEAGGCGAGVSGIGVVIERSANFPSIQVQKKLDFFVDESVADYLALMDGLLEAAQNKIMRVFAFTDSEILYDQIINVEKLENPLLLALRQRILEHAKDLDTFILKLVPYTDLERPLHLAQVAIGIVSFPAEGDESYENCSICSEEKPAKMMITMKCSHKFCSHCMKTYVNEKVQSAQVPIRCPQLRCKYYISATECRSFLPVVSYEMLERALADANVLHSDKIYCPFPNCSVLFYPHECLSARASSSSQSENSCVECPVCHRFICVECGVSWHSLLSCEEYRNLPLEERDAGDITLHRLAQNKRWRRCQQCWRMIELTHGCCHMTCRCGHEFCYSCGAGYRDGEQTCHVVVKVAPGTVIREAAMDGEQGELLLELLYPGQRALMLPGGRGGRGNASFKSGTNKVPKIAEIGEEGPELWLELELKLVADVGIIGAPNAGKSTLLSVISAAQPAIANYPFTTLLPNLGVVSFDYDSTMVVADLPGLLEGAHRGFGLGHEFLQHTERCSALVHVVDGSSQQPEYEFDAVRLELELFDPELAEKPYLVAYNKMDLLEASERWVSFKENLQARGIEPFCMSAVMREATHEVTCAAYELVRKRKEDNKEEGWNNPVNLNHVADMVQKQRTAPINEFEISHESSTNTWHVVGSGLQHFVQMTNWRYIDSERRFQHVLEACGVYKSLVKLGVKEGDTVVVGEMEMVWHDSADSSPIKFEEGVNQLNGLSGHNVTMSFKCHCANPLLSMEA